MDFKKLSKVVLVYNLFVILWGAFVRASGSGAGCGAHWPLCNGEIVPRIPEIETAIELFHRVTSGICLILLVMLLRAAWVHFPRGHVIRISCVIAAVFTISEALLGAGLVLFELVADNASSTRAIVISLHLVNTFALVAALALTVWWAEFGVSGKSDWARVRSRTGALLGAGLLALLLTAASGAIAALGNTLFPSESLLQGIAQDFSSSAHFLIQLRIWHPVLAVSASCIVAWVAWENRSGIRGKLTQAVATWLLVSIGCQFLIGVLNLALLAPTWIQLVHLLAADVVWSLSVILFDCVLRIPVTPVTASRHS